MQLYLPYVRRELLPCCQNIMVLKSIEKGLYHIYTPTTKIEPINKQCSYHIETSQLIYNSNQLTGFYMIGTLVVNELICSFLIFQEIKRII